MRFLEIAFVSAAATSVLGGVLPTYRVEPVVPVTTTMTLLGASEAGHMVGYRVLNGQLIPYVILPGGGVTNLPLPAGYNSGTALDVNSIGVVVGAVDDSGFPYDGGEPAIWTPDGSGGYTVTIPEQFETMPSPLGVLSINGGMAVAVNDAGTVVGWSRYQGFQGGPTTQFSASQAPVNLRAAGFEATVQALNENDVIVGDGLRMDLNTGVVAHLGVPTPGDAVSINFVIGYAINDNNEVVAAARRATSLPERWVTYIHNQNSGWSPLNPSQIGSPFVGFYDNNNLGDVSASGGVRFAEEGILLPSFDSLIRPDDAGWDPSIGFIGNDRRVYTSALETSTGQTWLVVLVPEGSACNPADLNQDGILDLADIQGFITAFTSQNPAADLAPPTGVFDLADVQAFIASFTAGCP